MADEKPLHVRVAEKIGWRDTFKGLSIYWEGYLPLDAPVLKREHCGFLAGVPQEIPHYDTDWSAIGPLIERYRISLRPTIQVHEDPTMLASWDAYVRKREFEIDGDTFTVGVTPLIAVCTLILALNAAGKRGLRSRRASAEGEGPGSAT